MTVNAAGIAVMAIFGLYCVSTGYSAREPFVAETLNRDRFTGASFAYFERHEKHRLSTISGGKSVKEDSSLDCGFTCTGLPWCLSYNFLRSADDDGKHLCELLASDRFNNTKGYNESGEFDHFSVASPCSQSPCENGGTCVALYDKNDFSCSCTADYIGKRCEVMHPATCKEAYDYAGAKEEKAYLLKMDTGKVSIFCHMTNISSCGGGGWTLVMKINGSKSTFSYGSTYWSNKETYNLDGGTTGLDNQETKLPSYWNTPFTKLCLGMKVGGNTRFLLLNKQASSLYSLIADGSFRSTSLGRDKWKSLITGSSFHRGCDKEGFNSGGRVRIGIIGSQGSDCNSSESFIGFGSSYSSCFCGNFATRYADNGDRRTRGIGYIFVQ